MDQPALFHDTILDALGAAVLAIGGVKKVAPLLWPNEDQATVVSRLRNALNPEHQQKLCPMELLRLARLAAAIGDFAIPHYIALELGCEFKSLSPVEAKKRAKKARRKALLDELARLDDDE